MPSGDACRLVDRQISSPYWSPEQVALSQTDA
jgi:hypothetical protein